MRNRIPKEQIELLRAVPALLELLARASSGPSPSSGRPSSVEEGAYLTRQGEPGREFFLVLDGVASCRVRKSEVRPLPCGRLLRRAGAAPAAACARPTSWR